MTNAATRESGIRKGGYARTAFDDPEHVLVRARTEKRCIHSEAVPRGWDCPKGRGIEPGQVYLRMRAAWLETVPLHIECAIELGYVEHI